MIKLFTFALFFFVIFCGRIFSQWELRYPDIPTDHINDICFLNDQKGFIVNDGGSVLMTTNGGATWQIKAHFQRNVFSEIKFVDDLHGFSLSPHSYIGDNVQLIYTSNGGELWQKADVNIGDAITFLPLSNSMILKAVDDGTIKKLDNFYGNWVETYKAPYFFDIDLFAPYGEIKQFQKFNNGDILALGASRLAKQQGIISDSVSFILMSKDYGSTWDTLWCDLPIAASCFYFVNNSTGWLGAEKNYIYKTTDGGRNWNMVFSDTLMETNINSIFAVDSLSIYAVNETGVIFYSKDGGLNWNKYQLPESTWQKYTIKFVNAQKGFVSGTDFWVTTDSGNSWNRVSKSIKDRIWKIDFVNDILGWAAGDKGIYKTTDGGYNWTHQYSGSQRFYGLDMIDSLNGWATTNLVFKTTDGGKTWDSVSVGNGINLIRGVKFLNHDVGILYEVWNWTTRSTINFVTIDGGKTWRSYPIQYPYSVSSFFKVKFTDSSHLWFANQQGLWLSRDTAKTWTLIDSVNGTFSAFDLFNSQICWIQNDFDQVAITNDGGATWKYKNLPFSFQGNDMLIMGRDYFGKLNVLLCGFYGNILRINEDSVYGTYLNTTYTQNTFYSFSSSVSGTYEDIWAAGDGFTILHRKDFLSDVQGTKKNVPENFSLIQNYPNPFNPATIIKYQIPRAAHVSLKIYDILGHVVSTLINEEKNAGSYKVQFDASRFASGVYIYQLKAGNYISAKKMILLK